MRSAALMTSTAWARAISSTASTMKAFSTTLWAIRAASVPMLTTS
jgi:hypothetical protein